MLLHWTNAKYSNKGKQLRLMLLRKVNPSPDPMEPCQEAGKGPWSVPESPSSTGQFQLPTHWPLALPLTWFLNTLVTSWKLADRWKFIWAPAIFEFSWKCKPGGKLEKPNSVYCISCLLTMPGAPIWGEKTMQDSNPQSRCYNDINCPPHPVATTDDTSTYFLLKQAPVWL